MNTGSADRLPLTGAMRKDGEPLALAEYERAGGYEGLRKALREMDHYGLQQLVKEAGLRGRGGGGFPTAERWALVPIGPEAGRPKYVICNADEMEPGTFKDRILMEGNPHLLIEGMILAGYAMDSDVGYIFLRWAYKRSARRLARAIEEAYGAGYLGKDILGSGLSFDLYLHTSAGRYICGELSALVNSLEGRRANPRAKPPRAQVSGLFGRPSLVNNAETLCNVPGIARHGAEWYRSLGLTDQGGTKIFGVSGNVRAPGAWELPMGTPLRELIEVHAGGMREGYGFKAAMPGGASTALVLQEHLDTPMDYERMKAAGSGMGTGTAIVLDDRRCMVGAVLTMMRFFARESCGFCTPCREGLPWVRNILEAIEAGDGRPGDIGLLEEHTRSIRPSSTFCSLAPGAMEPLRSALGYFRDEFEAHIASGGCPMRGPA